MMTKNGLNKIKIASSIFTLAFWIGGITVLITYLFTLYLGTVKNDTLFNRYLIIYNQINEHRQKIGLSPMAVDEDLQIMADYYSEVCARHGEISHGYLDLNKIMYDSGSKAYEKYEVVSECLAQTPKSYPGTALWAWLLSKPHKEAIENPMHTKMGVGYAIVDGVYYYTLYMVGEK